MSIITDGVICLVDTTRPHVAEICSMEQDWDTAPYILDTPADTHMRGLEKPDVIYKSILAQDERMIGFSILKLDPDGISVELARIVISEKGKSFGSRAMTLIEKVCAEQLHRTRIWLDVFESNRRARRVYENCGYVAFDRTELQGKPLLLLAKDLLS